MDSAILNSNRQRFDTCIENAFNWLLRMQVASEAFKGGFLSGRNFRWLSLSKPFVYTEITGYGLQMLSDFIAREDHAIKEKALAAANYLLKIQTSSGCFCRGVSLPKNEIIDTSFSFDTAVCASALLDLYSIVSEERYLKSAEKAGRWLVEEAQNDDGSFKSEYSKDGRFVEEKNWFGDRGCLHGKNAIALLKLWIQTGDPAFRSSGIQVTDWVRSLQLPDGAFRVNSESDYVFTHAHCYATEGMLYAYYVTRNKDYLSSATSSAKWLASAQGRDGGLFNLYGKNSTIRRVRNGLFPIRLETVDAVAQAIRIWIVLYLLDNNKVFLESALKAADFLLRAQYMGHEDNLSGGFYQQMNSLFELPIMRTWSSIFAIQALRFLTSNIDHEEMIKEII